jgi:hypothetical protein
LQSLTGQQFWTAFLYEIFDCILSTKDFDHVQFWMDQVIRNYEFQFKSWSLAFSIKIFDQNKFLLVYSCNLFSPMTEKANWFHDEE